MTGDMILRLPGDSNGPDVCPHLVFGVSVLAPREAWKLLVCVFPLLPIRPGLAFPVVKLLAEMFSLDLGLFCNRCQVHTI